MQQGLVKLYQFLYQVSPVVIFQVKRQPNSIFAGFAD